jgi:hypothetical protein
MNIVYALSGLASFAVKRAMQLSYMQISEHLRKLLTINEK